MAPRLDLQALLVGLLGAPNVYFQPPPNVKIEYPCIVYSKDELSTIFADNAPYKNVRRYQLTVIDADPDSNIPEKVSKLPMCSYNRFFAADNLNHDVFTLFF